MENIYDILNKISNTDYSNENTEAAVEQVKKLNKLEETMQILEQDTTARIQKQLEEQYAAMESSDNTDEHNIIKHTISELKKQLDESMEERPFVCVHAKKGKYECSASSSYDAAKKAAEHWGLKGTAGIDAYLSDVEHTAEGKHDEMFTNTDIYGNEYGEWDQMEEPEEGSYYDKDDCDESTVEEDNPEIVQDKGRFFKRYKRDDGGIANFQIDRPGDVPNEKGYFDKDPEGYELKVDFGDPKGTGVYYKGKKLESEETTEDEKIQIMPPKDDDNWNQTGKEYQAQAQARADRFGDLNVDDSYVSMIINRLVDRNPKAGPNYDQLVKMYGQKNVNDEIEDVASHQREIYSGTGEGIGWGDVGWWMQDVTDNLKRYHGSNESVNESCSVCDCDPCECKTNESLEAIKKNAGLK